MLNERLIESSAAPHAHFNLLMPSAALIWFQYSTVPSEAEITTFSPLSFTISFPPLRCGCPPARPPAAAAAAAEEEAPFAFLPNIRSNLVDALAPASTEAAAAPAAPDAPVDVTAVRAFEASS